MNIRKQDTSHLLSFIPSLVGIKEFTNLNQHVVDISMVRERNEKLTRQNMKALPLYGTFTSQVLSHKLSHFIIKKSL